MYRLKRRCVRDVSISADEPLSDEPLSDELLSDKFLSDELLRDSPLGAERKHTKKKKLDFQGKNENLIRISRGYIYQNLRKN